MTFGRRSFVAGAVAGAAAAGLQARPAAARLSPAAAEPVILLLDPGAPRAFTAAAAGILDASRVPVIDRRAGSGLFESVAWLAARPGRRLIGLLSDADAVLLDQMTRDGAMRCLSSAQHCAGTDASGQSRHRITALCSNAGLARLLAIDLAAAGMHFSIASEPPGTPRIAAPPPLEIAAPADPGGRGWEDTLGRVLAMIAAGTWPTRAPDAPGALHGRGEHRDTETFALRSFVFAS